MGTIAVLGSVFVDIKGFAGAGYDPIGRNIGTIRLVHGGVARNVAEDLAVLGMDTAFLSTIDTNDIGNGVLQHLQSAGVNTEHCRAADAGMGMWQVILGPDGNQLGAVSQVPDMKQLENLLEERGNAFLQGTDCLALEMDLNETIAEKAIGLAKMRGIPIYALPSNLSVALARPDLLSRLTGFVCNDIEFSKLIGRRERMNGEAILAALPSALKKLGLQQMIVTTGPDGCLYRDERTGEQGMRPAAKAVVRDVCGAGDSFFSGAVAALFKGYSLGDACVCGNRTAAITISSESNVPLIGPEERAAVFAS